MQTVTKEFMALLISTCRATGAEAGSAVSMKTISYEANIAGNKRPVRRQQSTPAMLYEKSAKCNDVPNDVGPKHVRLDTVI
ncbi:hypothetical protein ACN47E_005451 [Coniothyrium glycines]